MAPPRPLHCTGAQGPSGAAGQPPQKSNGPSTFKWPMVLPEFPLLTLSFAISALSLSTGLRSASPLVCSVRSHRPLQLHAGCCAAGHGGQEPLQNGEMYCCCSCSDGPGSTVQKANAPPCGLPREKEACAGTLEKWRDKYCEHHWPKDFLTAARWTSPGRRTPPIP